MMRHQGAWKPPEGAAISEQAAIKIRRRWNYGSSAKYIESLFFFFFFAWDPRGEQDRRVAERPFED
jgi:hypothetical protein